jgi:hypothetical protein
MLVECINNEDWKEDLTIGKKYEVIREGIDVYEIISDKGFRSSPFKYRFKKIKENKTMKTTITMEKLAELLAENSDKDVILITLSAINNITSIEIGEDIPIRTLIIAAPRFPDNNYTKFRNWLADNYYFGHNSADDKIQKLSDTLKAMGENYRKEAEKLREQIEELKRC